ncbi:hypothetical protein HYFRA_00000109 [Hymenoscyphus fraxineus]|uniref:Thioredoxin n=1 Tax=Hymenoscyphus fraxineus TaxID=746836 RepID=A0A9N9PS93_9HELO|nr:hypothetical protein HYFRA_00000109 [Hymenoscyphus fraxineus]
MSTKTVTIASPAQFSGLLKSSKIVVTDFYADWCGPCKAIAPIYEQLSAQLTRPNRITFTKVNVDTQKEIAASYNVTAMPTFMIFKDGKAIEKIQGADARKLQDVIKKLAAEADGAAGSSGFGGSSSSGDWRTGELPKGYGDITDQVDVKGLELLNSDTEFGTVRVLVESSKPTGLQKGKASGNAVKDWVESDTDEQLMLFMPFQALLKVHTLQITSLPPTEAEDDEEIPMRPKTLQIYTNRPHILGFEEADDTPITQSITLSENDWDATGTATIPLRFVKFQNVTSLVIFIVDGDGEGERVRIDRLRLIGESGEKRDQGKLEKVSDE